MTIEEMKALLKLIMDYDNNINALTDEINYWKNKREVDISEHIQCLKDKIQCLTDEKLKVSRTINKLSDPVARTIFIKRYILCSTWKQTAASCGRMSVRNAKYIHDYALSEFVTMWTTD